MTAAEGVVSLPVDRRELFGALTDVGRWPEWNVACGAFVDEAPASVTLGTAFATRLVVLEVADVLHWRVVELRPAERFAVEGRGRVGSGRIDYTLEDQGARVDVRYRIGLSVRGSRVGPLRSLTDHAVRSLAVDVEYSLRRLGARTLGSDVDAVEPPAPGGLSSATGHTAATMARVAKRLIRAG